MLIDNKNDYLALSGTPSSAIKSVVDFIRKYTGLDTNRKGVLDVVTGYFTIAGRGKGGVEMNVIDELITDCDMMV